MSPRSPRTAVVGLRLAQAGVALAVLGPLVHRFGLLGVQPALAAFGLGLLASAAALAVAPVAWVLGRGDRRTARRAGTIPLIAAAVLALPIGTLVARSGTPAIHHVTTDPEAPPRFEAIVALRGEDANPIEYPGAEVATLQRRAYPDLRPVRLASDPTETFSLAVRAARQLGWEIIDASEPEGRIEATDKTRWFGFVDDVVVRIRPDGEGSRVDLRSVSRVGVGDLGTNAARIRAFVRRLRALDQDASRMESTAAP